MNKTNMQRLLHSLLPFMIMTMIQRSLLLIFGYIGLDGEIANFLAFLPSAICAALIFRIKTYTVEDENNQAEIPPLVPKPLLTSVVQTLFTCGCMIVVMYFVAALIGGGSDAPEMSVLSVLSTLLIHPIIEELLFRKMFYGELRMMNPIFGCTAQALMFAIVHNTVESMIYALCSGVILAILYEYSGRIETAVAVHIIINLRSFLCLTVLSSRPDIAQAIDVTFIALGLAAFLLLGIFRGRQLMTNSQETTQAEDERDD